MNKSVLLRFRELVYLYGIANLFIDFKNLIFNFYLCVHGYVCLCTHVCTNLRRLEEGWISWDWSHRTCELCCGSSARAVSSLTAQPSLQAPELALFLIPLHSIGLCCPNSGPIFCLFGWLVSIGLIDIFKEK